MTIICPCCWDEYPDDQAYIAHRFRTISDWLTNCGELDTAARYALKDPADYHLEHRLIVPNDSRTCAEQATDDHNETVARQAGCTSYTRTDGQIIDLEAH